MRKFISTLLVMVIFVLPALAQQNPSEPPPDECYYGHINSPTFVCEPPPESRAVDEPGNDDKVISGDESAAAVIRTFIAEFKSSIHFLN